MKTYRVVRRNGGGARIHVPAHIAPHIPDETWFTVELTEDGILYRRVVVEETSAGLPDWVTTALERSAA